MLLVSAPDLEIKVPSPSISSVSAIVGGVIGGVAALVLILVTVYFLFRRLRKGTTPIDEFRSTENWVPINEVHAFVQSEEITASPAELPPNPPPSYTSHPPVLLAHDPSINSATGIIGGNRHSFWKNTQNDSEGSGTEVRSSLFTQNPLSGADDISPNTQLYAGRISLQ